MKWTSLIYIDLLHHISTVTDESECHTPQISQSHRISNHFF